MPVQFHTDTDYVRLAFEQNSAPIFRFRFGLCFEHPEAIERSKKKWYPRNGQDEAWLGW